MSSDKRVQGTLALKTDNSISKAANDIRGLNEELVDTNQAAKAANNSLLDSDKILKDQASAASKAGKETKSFTDELQGLNKQIARSEEINKLVDEYKDLAEELGDSEKAAKQLEEALKDVGATQSEIGGAARRFAGVSSDGGDVDLEGRAGKAESAVRGLGGAVGVLGGEAGQAIESVALMAAEVPAMATGLFDAKSAASGLGGGMGKMALGMGAAGVAVVALTAVVAHYAAENRKAAEEVGNTLDRQFRANEMESLSNEELIRIREDALSENIVVNKNIADANDSVIKEQQEFNERRKSAMQGGIGSLADVGRIIGTEGGALDKAKEKLQQQEKALEDNNSEIENANRILEERGASVGGLSEQEQELAQITENVTDVQSENADSINDELIPAQKEQIQTTEALAETAKDYSAELQAAAKKTADADKAVTASRNALFKSSTDISRKEKELAQEQLKATEEYNLETIKLNQDAQDKLKADREKALRDQSFLEVFDIESDFESQRQKREQERLKGLAELQQELADERAVKKEALAAESAEEFQALFDAIAEREEARKEERSLQEKAEREKLNIIDESHRHQIQSYQQLGDFTSQLFGQITQMASNSTSQIESILGSLDGKIGGALGGAGGGSVTNNLNFGGGGMSKAQQRSIARMAGQ